MSHLVIATNSPRNIWYYTSQQDLPNFAVNEAKSFTISFHPMPQGEKRSLEYSAFQFPAIGEYLMKTSFFLTKGTQMCPVSFGLSKLSADLFQLKVEMTGKDFTYYKTMGKNESWIWIFQETLVCRNPCQIEALRIRSSANISQVNVVIIHLDS